MKINPTQLAENGYVLLDILDHKEIIPFVRLYLRKSTFSSRLYTVINLSLLAFLLLLIYIFFTGENTQNTNIISQISFGIPAAFLLIPLHEYIHVMAYKSQGALETSYDANIKKFYFMALANNFVTSKKEFRIIALAPFISITLLGFLLMPFLSIAWQLSISTCILVHAAFCSGDFGLLSYFDFHKDKEVVTYDNIANKESFFWAKPLS